MRINKVKYSNKDGDVTVVIGYSRPPEDDPNAATKRWDHHEITRSQPPLPSFVEAMAALAPFVVELCEEQEEIVNKFTPHTVNFGYKNGVWNAIISANKALDNSNGSINLNTPLKWSESPTENGGGDETNIFSEEAVARLELVMTEAQKYERGERGKREIQQPTLSFDDAGEPDDENVRRVLPDLLAQVCEEAAPDLLAQDKCKIVMMEDMPYVCVGTTGNATEGWQEARVWRAMKRVEFEGETCSFEELPLGGNLRGLQLSYKNAKWVLTGEEIILRPEQPAAVPSDPDAETDFDDEEPFKIENTDSDEE